MVVSPGAKRRMRIRTYSELIAFPTFDERYEYLRLGGSVGETSFGFDRYLNQMLYKSREWRITRNQIITRDDGRDLGIDDRIIGDRIVIHHMNPIAAQDIEDGNPDIFDPRFLICVSERTHQAIHYGDKSLLPRPLIERRPGDTCPWG